MEAAQNDNNHLLQTIQEEEIQMVLKKKNRPTAPGPDGIGYNLIKMMPQEWIHHLAMAYTQILHSGDIPPTWKEIYTHPILKPNTAGHQATDYRPISLLNTLRKIFEKIIHDRLTFYLERMHLWPATQFGFRKGFNTTFNI
ncbi:hypothetical protein ANN_18706 [Periplaneta americana]|uniref:Reverse transcriptase domain-containing protein n=1 Tax=Periplaneta americana TaxID=6978 RepID=A0ABQ8SPH8_PERAM|nr:hypothetical protein ANN_18706 [Periplaneta americana]